jgi:hypothetical protein
MGQIVMTFDSGVATTIYNEHIELENLGKMNITRASHVEPTGDGKWTADMTPVGGPILGPFEKRSIALDEEVKWLKENIFNLSKEEIE